MREKAPHSKSIVFLIAVYLAFAAILFAFSFAFRTPLEVKAVTLFVSLLLLAAFWSFWNMSYGITSEGVTASMPPFTLAVPFKEITGVHLGKTSWWRGWGLRVGIREIGFVSRQGETVEIEKKSGLFRKVILTPSKPAEFLEALKKRLK